METAEIIAGNDDILTEILFRLPAKSLLRFKSVSKHWLSLISSTHLSSLHTLRHPKPSVSGLIYLDSPSKMNLIPLNPSSPPSDLDCFNTHKMKILQSCNGLLLCSSFPEVGVPRSFYISNPTTNQLFTLPSIPSVLALNLAFDPSISTTYKVICVSSSTVSASHYQINIYESDTRAWRLSGSPFQAPFAMVFGNGVFWNGAIHWINHAGNTLYFDVHTEIFGSFPAPPFTDRWGKRRSRYFGQSGGHLHLIEIYEARSIKFDVYEMNKDYSEWIVRFHVDLEHLVEEFPEMVMSYMGDLDSVCYLFAVLSVVEEEDEDDSSLLIHIPGKFVSYNFNNKMFKIVSDFKSSNSLRFGLLHAYHYIQTLASVC
ncbi:F-box family protein [Euphorbia peplus]|nr:F-box family protein [Euphorbia peplus]